MLKCSNVSFQQILSVYTLSLFCCNSVNWRFMAMYLGLSICFGWERVGVIDLMQPYFGILKGCILAYFLIRVLLSCPRLRIRRALQVNVELPGLTVECNLNDGHMWVECPPTYVGLPGMTIKLRTKYVFVVIYRSLDPLLNNC